jgi:phosphomannomutase
MPRIFGTDGVRGLANGVITAELAVDLGVAAARVLVDQGGFSGQRPVAVVGRDTRISGQFLEHAVVAGLASAGVDVLRLRVLPTPGVAYLTDALDADLGVVISASHNPMPDNGIKFLARGGVKLDDSLEREIARRAPTSAGSRRTRPASRSTPTTWSQASTSCPPGFGWCSTAPTVLHPRSAPGRFGPPAWRWSRSTTSPTA